MPGAPTVTQVTAGDGVVTVNWAPPASDGGSPVLRYQVTATPSGARQSVGAATTSATLTGQPDGTRECVQVQAINRVGGGPLSPAGQSCATPLKDSPGPVSGVQASESAPGQITLTWTQPSLGPYHTPIESYTVRGGPAPVTVTTTSTVLNGLSDGHDLLVHGRGDQHSRQHRSGQRAPSTSPPGRRRARSPTLP